MYSVSNASYPPRFEHKQSDRKHIIALRDTFASTFPVQVWGIFPAQGTVLEDDVKDARITSGSSKFQESRAVKKPNIRGRVVVPKRAECGRL